MLCPFLLPGCANYCDEKWFKIPYFTEMFWQKSKIKIKLQMSSFFKQQMLTQ
jgi:hypothetical protein